MILLPILVTATRTLAVPIRNVHLHSALFAGGMFRARRRLPVSNNEWGPLTDLPDFTILGKQNPPFTSVGQRRRAIENYEFAKDVVRLSGEISETKHKHHEQKQRLEEQIHQTRKSRLKSKGTFAEVAKDVLSDDRS